MCEKVECPLCLSSVTSLTEACEECAEKAADYDINHDELRRCIKTMRRVTFILDHVENKSPKMRRCSDLLCSRISNTISIKG